MRGIEFFEEPGPTEEADPSDEGMVSERECLKVVNPPPGLVKLRGKVFPGEVDPYASIEREATMFRLRVGPRASVILPYSQLSFAECPPGVMSAQQQWQARREAEARRRARVRARAEQRRRRAEQRRAR